MVKLSKIAIKKTWIPLVNIISTTSDEMDKEITYKAGCKKQEWFTKGANDRCSCQENDWIETKKEIKEIKALHIFLSNYVAEG